MGKNSWNGFERNCLFANRGQARFVDVGRVTGSDGLADARAVAAADLDRDGRVDLVAGNNAGAPTLYLNRVAGAGGFVALDLVGRRGNRDAVGARVRLTAGDRTMMRTVEAGSGFATQSSPVLHFGLGEATQLDSLEIDWPGGARQRLIGEELRRSVTVNARSRLEEPYEEVRTKE